MIVLPCSCFWGFNLLLPVCQDLVYLPACFALTIASDDLTNMDPANPDNHHQACQHPIFQPHVHPTDSDGEHIMKFFKSRIVSSPVTIQPPCLSPRFPVTSPSPSSKPLSAPRPAGLQHGLNQPATQPINLGFLSLQPASPEPAPAPNLFMGPRLALGGPHSV